MTRNAGVASPFATLSPFKSCYHFLKEAVVLGGARFFRKPEPAMRQRAFLHHAYWIRVPSKNLRSSPAIAVSPAGALLFLSSFTGSQADYLRGFTASLPTEMDLIWDCSTDWPGAEDNAKCAAFIGKYGQAAGAFFNAYGTSGVRDLRRAISARLKLDEFATELADADDRQFENAFTALATTLLTDANPQAPELT
jgi:hypothetical protein